MWCVVSKNALNKEMIAQDFLASARTRIARTYDLRANKGDCEFRARNTLRVRACYFFCSRAQLVRVIIALFVNRILSLRAHTCMFFCTWNGKKMFSSNKFWTWEIIIDESDAVKNAFAEHLWKNRDACNLKVWHQTFLMTLLTTPERHETS